MSVLNFMEKILKVYPISTGNELNVFATEEMQEIKIMDLTGNVVHTCKANDKKKNTINIKELPTNAYIVEVFFNGNRICRSMFVKL